MERPNALILDTETTGLDGDAEVVELAVIDCAGSVPLDTLVRPIGPIPVEAAAIHGITDAMLLGYSSWRDAKTAILVFNRGTSTSTVLDGVREWTEAHQYWKRTVDWKHESGFRYVFHHPGDRNRELTVTVLVFDVPLPS